MKRKFYAASLIAGIMSISVSVLASTQKDNEMTISTEVAMMDSNVDEVKCTISAFIQEIMQKYDTLDVLSIEEEDMDTVINPEMREFEEYVEQKKILYQNRQNAFGFEVEKKNVEITYKDITYENGVYIIEYVVDETLQYAHLDDPTYISTEHKSIVELTEDGFMINDDTSNDPIDLYIRGKISMEEYIEADLKEIEKELEAEQRALNGIEQDEIESISTDTNTLSFDRTAMYEYAYENYDKRPSQWGDFDGMGGDCTNFVSQIIYAGGAPFDTTGNYTWYYYGMSNRAPAWTSVTWLHDYLVNNDYIGPQGDVNSSYDVYRAMVGDVIQIDFENDETYDHSTCIVHHQTGTSSQTTIAAHTYNVWNYPINNYSGAKRWIHLTGYME